jgi:hypothetical protein
VKTAHVAAILARMTEIVDIAVKISVADMRGSHSRELKNAAAGLLRNLAPPKANKEIMRKGNALGAVAKLLEETSDASEELELCITTLRLLRNVILGSKANVAAFLDSTAEPNPLPPFQALLKRVPSKEVPEMLRNFPTRNHALQQSQSNAPNPRVITEIGRAIVEIYRAPIQDQSTPSNNEPFVSIFDTSCNAVEALLFLLHHPDPGMTSEAWLGLTIMSRTLAGATSIWCAFGGHGRCPTCTLPEDPNSLTYLDVRKILFAFRPEAEPSRKGADRKNAILFASEILKYMVSCVIWDRIKR